MALAAVCGLEPAGDPRGGRPIPLAWPRRSTSPAAPSIPWRPAISTASGSAACRRTESPRRRPASGSASAPADRSLYLHVDVDGLDPRDAPAVGYPEPDGARLADLLGCRAALPPAAAMTFSALSFDRASPEEAGRTVDACVRLVATPLGSKRKNGRG